MAINIGPATFEDHISIELISNKWTDTFIFPISPDKALGPWAYAEVVKTVLGPLRKSRRSPSLWVPVIAPGTWYFKEIKYALRNASIPVAVTQGRTLPGLLDFSKAPGIYHAPCADIGPLIPQSQPDLSENALRCLLLMACFTVAYTNEVVCSLMISERTARASLKILESRGLIEHHPNDGNIDDHLLAAKPRLSAPKPPKMWNGNYWPYWRIRRPGVSAALRAWGVPVGKGFKYHLEKNRLLNSPHRRRSRQWPTWLRRALPHAEIYAGWNEVSMPEIKARPDALAWGKIHGLETLFWLEVETGNLSRTRIEQQTAIRWLKATHYADAVGVRLVFVLLSMPYVQEAARLAFAEVPPNCAVILSGWNRLDFGTLPYPKWGEVVLA